MAIIKVDGKEYPAGLTMWAQLQFKRDKGKQVSELKTDEVEDFLYYVWLRVKGACLRGKIEFNYSFEEFLVHVDGDPTEALFEDVPDEIKKKTGQS